MNRMEMEIVSTQTKIYKPEFNPENDNYYDKNPYIKNQRFPIDYKCECKSNHPRIFNWNTFNTHCNKQYHKNYIINYKNHNQELNSANERIKELTKENEFLIRKNLELQKKIDELENEEGYQSF